MTESETPGVRRARERRAHFELLEALGSSLDLRVVLEQCYPLLLELVGADYGALGISSSGRASDYEWIVARLPPAFFAAYPELAAHDFVREAVTARQNRVLCDGDMIARRELEQNALYRRAREVGAPLEQVMAVMLHVDERWQSGLSLYRERRRPFSERDRQALQRLTPALANAVRNCHRFGSALERGAGLEALIRDFRAPVLLIAPPASEVWRSAGASELLARWFPPHELRAGHWPEPLLALLTADELPARWSQRGLEESLHVVCCELPPGLGRARRMLVLEERRHALEVPPAWAARLTPRERQMLAAVLRGWDNRLIAAELRCREATVKKHLQNVFDKLGVSSRALLFARAAEQQRC